MQTPKFHLKRIKLYYIPYNTVYMNLDIIIKNNQKKDINIYGLKVVLKNKQYEKKYSVYDIGETENGITFDDSFLEHVCIEASNELLLHLQVPFSLTPQNKEVTAIYVEYETFSKKYIENIYLFNTTLLDEVHSNNK